MIRNIGLFWSVSDVFWGRGKRPGALLGVPKWSTTVAPTDFRDQVGVYALYAGYELIYIGQTGTGDQRLLARLKQHRKDDLAFRWDRFSWFGVRWVKQNRQLAAVAQAAHPELARVLNHMEAILIHTAEPPLNRQSGRWGTLVEWYIQRRDPRLGPRQNEMVADLWKKGQIADGH
jgi:hypothetical protein